MDGLLATKCSSPFAHIEPRLVNTDLIRKRSLKWLLPIVLKLFKALFCPAAGIAHPIKPLAEKLSNIGNAVVIQPIDHAFNHGTCFICF